MQTETFFEELESELAPFTDEQVDLIADATENDLRYRIEIFLLYALAVALPTTVVVLGLYLVQASGVHGATRIALLLLILASLLIVIRSLKAIAGRYAKWRYQSSFLRQLAIAKTRLGR